MGLPSWTGISGLSWGASEAHKTALITLQVFGKGLHNARQVQVSSLLIQPCLQSWAASLDVDQWPDLGCSGVDKTTLIMLQVFGEGLHNACQVQVSPLNALHEWLQAVDVDQRPASAASGADNKSLSTRRSVGRGTTRHVQVCGF